MDRIDEESTKSSSKKSIISGFDSLDKIIHSFSKSNLYVLAGRPGMGKTALGLSIVHNIALKQNATVAIVTYEMTDYQTKCRLLAISSNITNERILNQNLNDTEKGLINKKQEELFASSIFIDCPATLNFKDLKSMIKDLESKVKIDFLFIDDIQRISISDDDRKYAANREQEVSKNVRDLKALAREMEIPIFAISQLNRDNKEREGRKPILTDIRDSGAIENDSDVVILLHRPEYYGITEDELGNSLLGVAELEIAKNRHGKTGQINLMFKKEIPKFDNLVSESFLFKPIIFSSRINDDFDGKEMLGNTPF